MTVNAAASQVKRILRRNNDLNLQITNVLESEGVRK